MKENWNKCETLGAKQKDFKWTYDEDEGLTIKRNFINGIYTTTFTNDEINKIIDYISQSKQVKLANNVSKLKNKTENDGLGKFVYDILDRDVTDAQAMSQFAAIFVNQDILGYNNKKRNMLFWVENENWRKINK